MSNGNRVEELESKVSELEATVRGLTEELVEANERLRQLEAAVDVDVVGVESSSDDANDDTQTGGEVTQADFEAVHEAAVEADKVGETKEGDEDDAEGSDPGDDIIVA